ncbi:MAG: DUF4175 family protein [bacterium]
MPDKSFQKIYAFLGTVIEGRLRVRRLEGGAIMILGLLAVVLLAPAAVLAQPHFGYSAVIYLAVAILLLAVVAARALWLIRRPPSRESIALEIEGKHFDLGSNLISSLQLYPAKNSLRSGDPTSPELIDALVLETAAQVGELDPGSYVSDANPRWMGRLAGVLAGTAFLAGILWPGLYPNAGHLLANAIDLMPSRITHLYLLASSETILPGSSVVFDVRTEGRIPDEVGLEFFAPGEKENQVLLPMKAAGEGRFRMKWKGGGKDMRVVARSGRFRSDPVNLKIVAPPRVEAIEIVNFPPEYTPFPPTRQTEATHIRAFLGSSVLVRVKPSKPLSEAVLALADGWRIALKKGEKGFLEGVILVGSPGSYQIRLKDKHGFPNLDPPRYRIDIIPDTPPEIRILEPGKDLTVEADEVIRMRYRVSDDFGVQNVGLEVRAGRKAPRRLRLWAEENSKKIVQGEYVIDLRSFGIRSGEVLSYRVLAEDIDTVSGPKRGASRFYRIKIRDREAVIASLDRKLEEISSNLLDLLGDYLEERVAPPDMKGAGSGEKKSAETKGEKRQKSARAESLFDKAWGIMKKIQSAKELLRPTNPREALASMDLTTLSRRLREAMDRHLIPQREGAKSGAKGDRRKGEEERLSRKEEATETMERLASMGEDMLRHIRMDRAGKTADQLMQRQRSLTRALEEMRKSGNVDQALKRRFEKELSKLQQELSKLMQQLAGLAQRMPAEFMNQRGMRNMPMQNMMDAFNRIRQQMQKGNFRSALDTLRRLMSQIQRIRNAMRGLRRRQMRAQQGGMPMRRRQSELGAIVKEQQAVLSDTIDVFGDAVQRLKKGWPKSLSRLAGVFREKVGDERKLLERLAALKCKSRAAEPTEEDKMSDALQELRETLEAVPGFTVPGSRAPKLTQEDKFRLEEENRADARRADASLMDEMERSIRAGEWGAIFRLLRPIRKAFKEVPCIEKAVQPKREKKWNEAAKKLDGYLKKVERKPPLKERRSLAGLTKRQKALEGRLSVFRDRLRRLMQMYPFLDPKVLRRVEEARAEMKKAGGALGKRRSSTAIPHEERVLELLAQSQNAMRQSMRRMAQRGRLGMGTPRGAGIYRRSGRGWWARNPNLPGQDESRRRGTEGQDGRQGIDFSEVRIPDREQYQVPEKFREEVMEALKEGLPESLRSEIENYYERLTR